VNVSDVLCADRDLGSVNSLLSIPIASNPAKSFFYFFLDGELSFVPLTMRHLGHLLTNVWFSVSSDVTMPLHVLTDFPRGKTLREIPFVSNRTPSFCGAILTQVLGVPLPINHLHEFLPLSRCFTFPFPDGLLLLPPSLFSLAMSPSLP